MNSAPSVVDIDLGANSRDCSATASASGGASTPTNIYGIDTRSINSTTDTPGSNVQTPSGLTISFPHAAVESSTLTPVGQQVQSTLVGDTPTTFSLPLEHAEVMLGRTHRVYATDSDSGTTSRENFRQLQSASSSVDMADPPMPQEIGMANISPRQDDRQELSDTLNRTLHQCARDGDDESLLALLEHLGDRTKRMINKWDDNKMNPLHYAARYNHFRIVEILVKHGANVNHPGEDKQTALHYAAKYKKAKSIKKSNTTESNIGGAEPSGEEGSGAAQPSVQYANGHSTIILSGDDDTTPTPDGDGRLRPTLQLIESTEDVVDLGSYQVAPDSVIAFLVRNSADPNAKDAYGSTPLHFASMRDNETAVLDLLCMNRIQIEASDKQKMTALHLAATHDNKECCRLLVLKGAKLRVPDDENSTPLHMAATEGNTEVVKMLFQKASELDSWVTIQDMIADQDQEGSTALHLAVENGHYEVVQLCLEKNANVNKPRQNYVTPLHLAAASGDLRIVTMLVENNARINALDGDQATPLHRATAYDNAEVIQYLVLKGAKLEKADKDNFTVLLIAASNGHVESLKTLIRLGANITITDKTERTALHWAALEDQPEIIEALLTHKTGSELLDANDMYGNTTLHVAAQKGHMDCVKVLLRFNADMEDKNDEEQTPLHLAAQNGMTHIVKLLTQMDKTIVNDYDENSNTALHLAALEGHTKVAAVLLERGADIAARNCTLWTPIDCAAANGRVKMIRSLLEYDSPIDPSDRMKTTPLHLACKRGHPDCVKLLIERGADVNIRTADGFNCMDLAIDRGHKEVVQTILDSDKWLEAMKHAHIDLNAGGVRVTPMRKLIRKMPDLAEAVFVKCTETNEYSAESAKFEITFNYELLDDQYTSWEREDGSSRGGDSSLYGGSVYGDDNKVLEDVQPYSESKSEIKKNHPLLIMVRSAREDLLAHPLVTSLLRHKWHTVGRYFYYTNLILYLAYLVFITGFALTIPSPFEIMTDNFNKSYPNSVAQNASCSAQLAQDNATYTEDQKVRRVIFVDIGIWISIIIIGIKLLSEIFQLLNAKLSYIGYENILEWILYVSSLLFLIPFTPACKHYREPWQWQTGIVAVFLAWMELILIIRKLPRFGIYVVMFTHILSTFLQFFVVFFLFLIGFSISFYMLLANQTPFRSVENSLLKTAIMMIGEFEFDSIFNAAKDDPPVLLYYPHAAYIIFIIFIIVMSILIMNLLVGLAVDDIKGVQEQAVLTRMAMQVELALTVESMLPEFFTKKHIMRFMKIRPNLYTNTLARYCCAGGAGAVISGMSTSNLAAALNPELDDIEKVMEEQEKMKVQVGKLNSRSKELKAQNEKLESMLQALLTHHNVDFTDMDGHGEEDELDIGSRF